MDERVLVWAPPRDGRLTCGFLEERGVPSLACVSWEQLGAEAQRGAGALLLAGEFLSAAALGQLRALVEAQPPWSDLPILIVTAGDCAPDVRDGLDALGNVSLLHRPLSPDTLTSMVGSALRARRRQYEIRDLLRNKDETDRRKDEFLAMLAHELRNPLAPLRTGFQLLQLSPSDQVFGQTLKTMERQIGHLGRLVDDLLDVSRLTRRTIVLKRQPLDLRESVRQAVDAIRPIAIRKPLVLELSVPPDPIPVEADPVRVEQMVGNLLANALKFTPPGGAVRASATREGASAVVRVRDTGIGIPPDHLGRVFDLFAQTDRPLDRSQGGLGIGLTVVRLLADLHGGSAEVRSDGEGAGTEAVIRLPAQSAPPPAAAPRAGIRQVAGEPRRVLIIEDNADAAEMLSIYLELVGHEVIVARDGREGLDAAFRERPAVVICDLGLPGVDGFEVARTLRGWAGFESCLMIAVTGYGDVLDRERTRRAGFEHHLTKPASPSDVAALIAQATRKGVAHGSA